MTHTPEQTRAEVLRTLRLALEGPRESEQLWPGFLEKAQVIREGEEVPAGFSKNLPMVTPHGTDLVSVTPTILYGVGILYPTMSMEEISRLIREQSDVDDGDDGQPIPETTNLNQRDDADEDEDGDGDKENETRELARSLAVSFHIPAEVTSVEVEFRGARYKPFNVRHKGSLKLFERVPVAASITLNAEQNDSYETYVEGIHLKFGTHVVKFSETSSICTVWVVNETTSTDHISEAATFQSQLTVNCSSVLPYPNNHAALSESEASLEFLYRHVEVLAVGHGCDARATQVDGGWEISSEVFPEETVRFPEPDIGEKYAVGMLDLAQDSPEATEAVEHIIRDYAHWVDELEISQSAVDHRFAQTAQRHVDQAKNFLNDIREGWSLFRSAEDVRKSLCWASAAMNAQRRANLVQEPRYGHLDSDSGFVQDLLEVSPHPVPDFDSRSTFFGFGETTVEDQGRWRPFQLAFLLSQLPRIVDPTHRRREDADVIWMPTGGGKTEAYLGLSAFVILWERLRLVENGQEVNYHPTVLMRYTLTLLTAQQFTRAASMICAIEIIRETNEPLLGSHKFRIGAWLGQSSTPNRRKNAKDQLKKTSGAEKQFLLSRCPWCSCEMGLLSSGAVAGYREKSDYVTIFCPDETCAFNPQGPGSFQRLPVLEVDEDLYKNPPSFVVGTIDKFAQLSWEDESAPILGILEKNGKKSHTPPTLLIQDELHLIGGALGTLDALYEAALERLCTTAQGHRPVIVAATATTKAYENQILRLYGRQNSRLLPPPGFSIEDSFFARVNPENPGKTYVGICATGFGSVLESQLRALAAVAHAAPAIEYSGLGRADPWWTNLVFFGSKRSIGQLQSYSEINLHSRISQIAFLSGVRTGGLTGDQRAPGRSIREIPELTSTSRFDSKELMNRLAVSNESKESLDLCFATSMIEVGLDISRLGMMTVMGQPKSNSQYIQATGRVGRSNHVPGLVLVVLSPYNVRDLSHFESFRVNHQRLYAAVEPASVTPFTTQALQRGLAGAFAAVMRHTTNQRPGEYLKSPDGVALIEYFRSRAHLVAGDRGVELFNAELLRLTKLANAKVEPSETLPALDDLLENAEESVSYETKTSKWLVPRSMRSVEGESGVKVARLPASKRPVVPSPGTGEEDFE